MSEYPSPSDRQLLRFIYSGTRQPRRWLRIVAVRVTRDLVRRQRVLR